MDIRIPEVDDKLSVDLDYGFWETGTVVYKREREYEGEKYWQIVVDFKGELLSFTVDKDAEDGEFKLFGGRNIFKIIFVD